MAQLRHRRGSRFFRPFWLKAIALATAVTWVLLYFWTPVALAVPSADSGKLPAVKLFGYARGPSERHGTAARKAHYVPASATRAKPTRGVTAGHRAPQPRLAPSPVGVPALVQTGSALRGAGREIAGHPVASTLRKASSAV